MSLAATYLRSLVLTIAFAGALAIATDDASAVSAPTISAPDASVLEDGSGQLSLSATLVNPGSEFLTIQISGIAHGWTVTGPGIYNPATGIWGMTLAPGQNFSGGPILQPPAHRDLDLNNLTMLAIATQVGTGDQASSSDTFDVIVDAVADQPGVSVSNASGTAGQAIGVTISGSLIDTDGSESLSFLLNNVPANWVLSAGTELGGGSYALTPAQLVGLTVTPAVSFSGLHSLQAVGTAMESPIDGETTTANNTASRTRTIQVNVAPAPTATITPTPPVTATSTETPTHTATPTMVGSCAGAPLPDCRAARQALLKLVGATDPSKDRLLFKWQKGAATAATEFGDPRAATVTSLCLYDGGALKLQAIVPPDGERWRLKGDTADPKGFDFKDANGASGGVTLVKLTAGEEGKASILLKAKRGGLSLPGPVGAETYFGGAVTAQLVNSDGRCWSVGFTGLATKNAGFSSAKPQFKHKCKSSLAAR